MFQFLLAASFITIALSGIVLVFRRDIRASPAPRIVLGVSVGSFAFLLFLLAMVANSD
jgi:hypothetical protein